ncbi:MAG: pyruvate kinase [bacterium]
MTFQTKRTKIIATLGPASNNVEVLTQLVRSGADFFRINASHLKKGESISERVKLLRKVAKKLKRSVAVMMDLQGPKIRLGQMEEGVVLEAGDVFELGVMPCLGNRRKASVSYDAFVTDVSIGDVVFIDDGKLRLKVLKKQEDFVECEVLVGGPVLSHKGVNLPETKLTLSVLTDKDKLDIKQAISAKVDYLALSFVGTVQDVLTVREYLETFRKKHHLQLISKLERQIVLDHLEALIEVSDAVMVARGDLGIEIGLELVPQVQKRIIRAANKYIKPVIVATQMLESTIHGEMATRAEVSDVANAIYDHCDAVMLSAETAIGVNPVNSVETMSKICLATDQHLSQIREDKMVIFKHIFHKKTLATSMCKAADQIAEENHAKAIMAFTSSGNTPLITSKLNTKFLIIAPTDEEYICNRLALYRGVIPLLLGKKYKNIMRWTDMIRLAVRQSLDLGYIEKGDVMVVLAGIPIGQTNGINSIRVITV